MTRHHPRVTFRRAPFLVALSLATACGAAPDLDKELTTVRSWTATAELASEDARTGAISQRMASQLHDRAIEARQDAAASLADAARSADDRRRAHLALDSLDAAVRALGARGAPAGRNRAP
jgi:hypothetical protein